MSKRPFKIVDRTATHRIYDPMVAEIFDIANNLECPNFSRKASDTLDQVAGIYHKYEVNLIKIEISKVLDCLTWLHVSNNICKKKTYCRTSTNIGVDHRNS